MYWKAMTSFQQDSNFLMWMENFIKYQVRLCASERFENSDPDLAKERSRFATLKMAHCVQKDTLIIAWE